MSIMRTGAPSSAGELTKLERVLAERQKIIGCGNALAATGRCCRPGHTPRVLARELASLLKEQKLLLHTLAALLPPERSPI